jgi:PAS domain S-box-containing protein
MPFTFTTLKEAYIRVNHAAETLSGYKRDEIVGHNFFEFVSADDLRFGRKTFYAKLAEQGETSFEVDVIAKDGRRVPVEVRSRAIYENGVMVGVQGIARDITERKLAQDALQMFFAPANPGAGRRTAPHLPRIARSDRTDSDCHQDESAHGTAGSTGLGNQSLRQGQSRGG